MEELRLQAEVKRREREGRGAQAQKGRLYPRYRLRQRRGAHRPFDFRKGLEAA